MEDMRLKATSFVQENYSGLKIKLSHLNEKIKTAVSGAFNSLYNFFSSFVKGIKNRVIKFKNAVSSSVTSVYNRIFGKNEVSKKDQGSQTKTGNKNDQGSQTEDLQEESKKTLESTAKYISELSSNPIGSPKHKDLSSQLSYFIKKNEKVIQDLNAQLDQQEDQLALKENEKLFYKNQVEELEKQAENLEYYLNLIQDRSGIRFYKKN